MKRFQFNSWKRNMRKDSDMVHGVQGIAFVLKKKTLYQ